MQLTVDVAAPQDVLWPVVADVERWPEITASMAEVRVLGDAPLGAGSQVYVSQPRLRPLTWTVTTWDAPWSFTWESTTAGIRTVATHAVEPAGTGCRLTLTLDQSGLLAPVVNLAFGRLTRRYVEMEGAGMRKRAEERA